MGDYVSKVVLANGTTLIDLTSDDVTAADVASGKKFHAANGELTTGTCTKDSDTSADTATAAEILSTKTAHARGSLLTGTMANNGAATGTIATKAGEYTIPVGYHDGSGKVSIDATEQAKIIESNIKAGVEILGVTGTYTGEAITAQTKTANSTFSNQTILPDTGYDYLSQVTVNAILVQYADNSAGGKTVTIGSTT